MKKVTKFGLEVLTGKALSFLLEFIDKTGEKVFCLQMQIKLKQCMKSYMKYILSKFAIIVLVPEIIFVSD